MSVKVWGAGSGLRMACHGTKIERTISLSFSDFLHSQTHHLCCYLPHLLTNSAAEFCHFWHCGRRRKNFALVARFLLDIKLPLRMILAVSNSTSRKLRSRSGAGNSVQCPKWERKRESEIFEWGYYKFKSAAESAASKSE